MTMQTPLESQSQTRQVTEAQRALMHADRGGRLAVVAGEGYLPQHVVESALTQGFEVVTYTLEKRNFDYFKRNERLVGNQYWRYPGLMDSHNNQMKQDNVRYVVLAGKVSKSILLRAFVMDKRALGLWQKQRRFNDDAITLTVVREMEEEGYTVLPQVDFMQDLFQPPGLLTQRPLTQQEQDDMTYGFQLAKEMGRLDLGQTVVVSNGMALAIEAIEGTDQAIRRTRPWAKHKGGVVVKVAKPNQDTRFDVPTVGLRTLKSLKNAGLKVLAFEANQTLVVDPGAMVAFANHHDMTVVSVCP